MKKSTKAEISRFRQKYEILAFRVIRRLGEYNPALIISEKNFHRIAPGHREYEKFKGIANILKEKGAMLEEIHRLGPAKVYLKYLMTEAEKDRIIMKTMKG